MKNIEIIERARVCSPFLLSGLSGGISVMRRRPVSGMSLALARTADWGTALSSGSAASAFLPFTETFGAYADTADTNDVITPVGTRSWSPPV